VSHGFRRACRKFVRRGCAPRSRDSAFSDHRKQPGRGQRRDFALDYLFALTGIASIFALAEDFVLSLRRSFLMSFCRDIFHRSSLMPQKKIRMLGTDPRQIRQGSPERCSVCSPHSKACLRATTRPAETKKRCSQRTIRSRYACGCAGRSMHEFTPSD